jgi:hypothetical protein
MIWVEYAHTEMGAPVKYGLACLGNKYLRTIDGGWGPHGWVSVLGKWMKD